MRGLPGGPGERTGPVPCPFVCTHSSFFPSFFQAGLRTSPILREKRISQTVYPLQIRHSGQSAPADREPARDRQRPGAGKDVPGSGENG